MWPKHAEPLQDLSLVVDLDPSRCLDTADFLARHARRYGIRADLEFRRSLSGRAYDRHFVACYRAGPTNFGPTNFGPTNAGPRNAGPAPARPLWIMHVELHLHHPQETRVSIGLRGYRGWTYRSEAGRSAQQYRELLRRALAMLEENRGRPAGSDENNVIVLRPFIDRLPLASA